MPCFWDLINLTLAGIPVDPQQRFVYGLEGYDDHKLTVGVPFCEHMFAAARTRMQGSYLYGKGGTGKSFLLRDLLAHSELLADMRCLLYIECTSPEAFDNQYDGVKAACGLDIPRCVTAYGAQCILVVDNIDPVRDHPPFQAFCRAMDGWRQLDNHRPAVIMAGQRAQPPLPGLQCFTTHLWQQHQVACHVQAMLGQPQEEHAVELLRVLTDGVPERVQRVVERLQVENVDLQHFFEDRGEGFTWSDYISEIMHLIEQHEPKSFRTLAMASCLLPSQIPLAASLEDARLANTLIKNKGAQCFDMHEMNQQSVQGFLGTRVQHYRTEVFGELNSQFVEPLELLKQAKRGTLEGPSLETAVAVFQQAISLGSQPGYVAPRGRSKLRPFLKEVDQLRSLVGTDWLSYVAFGTDEATYSSAHALEDRSSQKRLMQRLCCLGVLLDEEDYAAVVVAIILMNHYWWDCYLADDRLADPLFSTLRRWAELLNLNAVSELVHSETGVLTQFVQHYPAEESWEECWNPGPPWNMVLPLATSLCEMARDWNVSEGIAAGARSYAKAMSTHYYATAWRYAERAMPDAKVRNLGALFDEVIALQNDHGSHFDRTWAYYEAADFWADLVSTPAGAQRYPQCRDDGWALALLAITSGPAEADFEVAARFLDLEVEASVAVDDGTRRTTQAAALLAALIFFLGDTDHYGFHFVKEHVERLRSLCVQDDGVEMCLVTVESTMAECGGKTHKKMDWKSVAATLASSARSLSGELSTVNADGLCREAVTAIGDYLAVHYPAAKDGR